MSHSLCAGVHAALFQSLLFEACGRTVNPVHGAVGLLWTGNWHLCQTAVETVLRGGVLHAPPDFTGATPSPQSDSASETNDTKLFHLQQVSVQATVDDDLDLGLRTGMPARMSTDGKVNRQTAKSRRGTSEEESEITTSESCYAYHQNDVKLLRLFF